LAERVLQIDQAKELAKVKEMVKVRPDYDLGR